MSKSKKPLTSNASDGELRALAASMVQSRENIARLLGIQHNGARDLYAACGYKRTLTYNDYLAKYARLSIARRVINAPVAATWHEKPTIGDGTAAQVETAFSKAWKDLNKRLKLYHNFSRVDKLAGLGRYGVLLLGFSDGLPLEQPYVDHGDLLYVQPYSEASAVIKSYVTDATSPRYGLPEMYSIKTNASTGGTMLATDTGAPVTSAVDVHHSRVLHIASDLMEDNVFGRPRLEAIFNHLEDLEKITGGSGEMFWKGGFPGHAFIVDKDASLSSHAKEELSAHIDEYEHNLRRILRLQGMDIKTLAPQVVDPTPHFNVIIQCISGETGIPVRILLGSERGELASSQDERNWNTRIAERRQDFATDVVLRPFIDYMIAVNILPDIEYNVTWPEVNSPSNKERAETASTRANALKAYVESGADLLYPPSLFLKKDLGLTDEEISEIDLGMYEDELQAGHDAALAGTAALAGAGAAAQTPPGSQTPPGATPEEEEED